jgi:hypothetical protein
MQEEDTGYERRTEETTGGQREGQIRQEVRGLKIACIKGENVPIMPYF